DLLNLPLASTSGLLGESGAVCSRPLCAGTGEATSSLPLFAVWRGTAQLHRHGVCAGRGEDGVGAHSAAVVVRSCREGIASAHGSNTGAAAGGAGGDSVAGAIISVFSGFIIIRERR